MATTAVIQFTCDSCSASESAPLSRDGMNTRAGVPKGWFFARRFESVTEQCEGYTRHDDSSPVLCAECTVAFLTWVKAKG